MASNGVKSRLISEFEDPTGQTINRYGTNRKRFRRCKSAPPVDAVAPDGDNAVSAPQESIFKNLHPSFRKVAIFLTIYLGLGISCFYAIRNQLKGNKTNGIVDAMYFCIVTMTTVGYGDMVPNSVPAKLLACAFVFTGMALIALSLSKAADYLVEKQEVLLVKAFHMRQKVGPSEILKEVEMNRVRYKCFMVFILLLFILIVGIVFLVLVEKLDFVDAFYCVCATITTLGYGDKSFSTEAGRMFAVFWILSGTICLAQFFLYIAEMNAAKRQKALVNWVLTRKLTNLDLEAADLDDDGVVGAAEFIIYKLKEMGKITQEEISLVMEEFDELDVDQSGTLSRSDILLAQP